MTEAQKPLEILVVEDNLGFIEASREYLKERKVSLTYASDLQSAYGKIKGVDGVITDLYFPNITGSGNKSEGKKILAEVSQYYDIEPKPLLEILDRNIEKRKEYLANSEKLRAIFSEIIGKEIKLEQARNKQYVGELYRQLNEDKKKIINEKIPKDLRNKVYNFSDYIPLIGIIQEEFSNGFSDLITALSHYEDETLQPLGIRIVEECKKTNKPVAIITSHHAIGQHFVPIASKYLGMEGIYHDILKEGNLEDADVFMVFKKVHEDPRSRTAQKMWNSALDSVIRRIH